MKGKTKSGFEFEISESRLDNMELIDALGQLEENPFAIGKICELLLGKEQKQALYEHNRTKEGVVPASKIEEELTEIFGMYGDTKN